MDNNQENNIQTQNEYSQTAPANNVPTPEPTPTTPEKKKTNVGLIIGIVIVGIIGFFAMIGFIGFLVINKTVKTAKEKTNQQASEIINNTSEIIDDVTSSVNSNWKQYNFSVKGQTIELPTSYKNLTNITGWDVKDDYKETMIPKNHYTLMNLYNGDKLALYTELTNNNEQATKYDECKVTRVGQTKYQADNGADKIIFPGNIKVGDQITKEKIVELFGEPSKIENYGSGNYVTDTYKYFADSTYTTINYYSIKVLNGSIDEITLDHRG